MFTISKEFSFEAAHRLPNHPGKCRHLHGHSYRATVYVCAQHLNDAGMVKDFADLKPVKEWIDANWDHNIILEDTDQLTLHYHEYPNSEIFAGKDPFVMNVPPTAENLAKDLFFVTESLLNANTRGQGSVFVDEVLIYETESCSASYRR